MIEGRAAHRPPGRRARPRPAPAWALLATVIAIGLPSRSTATAPTLDSVSGPYGVGFRTETRLDRARPFRPGVPPADDGHARPIRMFIWYPVEGGQPPTATWADYLQADHGPGPAGPPGDGVRESVTARLRSDHLEGEPLRSAVDRLLARPSRAMREATPAPGRFPLIVIGPGGSTPASIHALLGEHLASHGYVAVAIPSLPPHEGERWPFDQRGVALHVRDMEAALDHLLAWPPVDRGRIGLAAWSVGGVAQALMQMRNADIGALVSLDGATGYAYGLELLRAAIDFDEGGVSVPYLHAHGLAPARYEVEKDFTVFESLSTGPALLLTFPHLSHPEFTSRGVLERWAVDAETGVSVVAAYAVLLEAVRRFFETSFDDPANAARALGAWLADPELRSVVSARSRPDRPRSTPPPSPGR